jgi:hypothetical protein
MLFHEGLSFPSKGRWYNCDRFHHFSDAEGREAYFYQMPENLKPDIDHINVGVSPCDKNRDFSAHLYALGTPGEASPRWSLRGLSWAAACQVCWSTDLLAFTEGIPNKMGRHEC